MCKTWNIKFLLDTLASDSARIFNKSDSLVVRLTYIKIKQTLDTTANPAAALSINLLE